MGSESMISFDEVDRILRAGAPDEEVRRALKAAPGVYQTATRNQQRQIFALLEIYSREERDDIIQATARKSLSAIVNLEAIVKPFIQAKGPFIPFPREAEDE